MVIAMAATQGSASTALAEGTHDDGKHTSDCAGVMRQLGASALEEHDYFAESGLQKREVARHEVELNLRETELRIGPPSAAAAATTKDGGTAPPTTLMSATFSEPKQRKEIQMSDADILKEGTKFADPRLGRDSVEVKKSFLLNTNSAEKAAAEDGETTIFPHYHKVQLPSSFSSWDARVEQAGGSFGPFKSPRAHTVLKAHADHVSKPTHNLWLSHSKTAAQMLPSTGESTDVEQAKQNSSRNQAKRGPVGWPPVQSFRKNSLPASHSKSVAGREDKPVSGSLAEAHAAIPNSSHPLLVKVYMDGLGIGRKVDLKIHNSYHKLSATLEEMFQRFLNASHQVAGQKPVMKNPTYCGRKELNFLCGSEYVITYEDKDGDLMLMGDVPWGIFEETVKRLRIMKGYEAIGLAPRAPEKSRNRN